MFTWTWVILKRWQNKKQVCKSCKSWRGGKEGPGKPRRKAAHKKHRSRQCQLHFTCPSQRQETLAEPNILELLGKSLWRWQQESPEALAGPEQGWGGISSFTASAPSSLGISCFFLQREGFKSHIFALSNSQCLPDTQQGLCLPIAGRR